MIWLVVVLTLLGLCAEEVFLLSSNNQQGGVMVFGWHCQ